MKLGTKGRTTGTQTAANRAEEVRKRRTERSQERASAASQRAADPVRVRPVVVRGNAFGTPIHRQSPKRTPRRTFYVTMDQAAGTELRLPSIPLVNPGWRLLSGLIAIMAIVGIYSLWSSPFFRIDSADVTGLERLSVDEINATLELEDMPIIEVDAAMLTKKLNTTFPELVGVQVGVALPNIITVHATERQPVMAWQKGDQLRWLDKEGTIFPARGDAGPLVVINSEEDLPLVPLVVDPKAAATQTAEGETETAVAIPVSGARMVEPSLVSAAQALSQKLPAETQIVYSNGNGLGWIDPQGWQVFIGRDVKNFEDKYNMYQNLVSYLTSQGITPSLISVEHTDAPFYRLEP